MDLVALRLAAVCCQELTDSTPYCVHDKRKKDLQFLMLTVDKMECQVWVQRVHVGCWSFAALKPPIGHHHHHHHHRDYHHFQIIINSYNIIIMNSSRLNYHQFITPLCQIFIIN
jgi:hypothetical protein